MNAQSQPAKIARQYAEQVVAGEILACRWVQRACQRQLDDLAKFKGKASPYLFNPKLTDKDGRSFQPADNLCVQGKDCATAENAGLCGGLVKRRDAEYRQCIGETAP
jgi:hypothetical protein